MNTHQAKPTLRQHGFTLIEAIVVIVITAIVAGMVAVFIRLPVQGYVDTVARAQLTDLADTVLRRVQRDIRLALPNSIRVSSVGSVVYMELLLTKTGARYLADDDGLPGGDILSWTDASDRNFGVVGSMPNGKQTILAGDYMVVYNLGDSQEPANAYNCDVPCNRASVQAVAGNLVTMSANPFPGQIPPLPSPSRRFQVVTSAVTYVCDPAQKTLRRYWDYKINALQPTTAALLGTQDPNKSGLPGSALLADMLVNSVTNCEFDYTSLANTRSALIGLNLEFEIARSNSGIVKLMQQVHVDNTP